ncbi:MAG TPA: hypothetical protein VFI31_24485 [Pirellulales bacterium]|nr:hypothetical protein [Pirellulales bacterium]
MRSPVLMFIMMVAMSAVALAQTSAKQKQAARQRADDWYQLYRERMKNPVKLGKVPSVKLQERPTANAQQVERIHGLIAALAKVEKPDYGFSSTLSGHAFLPVDDQHESSALLITNHGLQSSSALKELVSLGADALPFLLKALDDQTQTKIRLEHRGGFGGMWFDQELYGNPLNPKEVGIIRAGQDGGASHLEQHVDEFTVKVGDLCFVAIGQIVGRAYQAVRYQPTACIVVNSPSHDTELASKVRKMWTSETPREALLQSLLRDYSSIGIHYEGDSLDVWSVGSDLQCGAALRLLYYYPQETAELIADRLARLDVEKTRDGETDQFIEREVKNGARTREFVQSISWSRHPAIRKAVTDLFLKATDDDIMLASLIGVDDPEEEIIPRRLEPILAKLPADEGPIYGQGWNVLRAWTKASPGTAKGAMTRYVRNGEVQRLQTVCAVLNEISDGSET